MLGHLASFRVERLWRRLLRPALPDFAGLAAAPVLGKAKARIGGFDLTAALIRLADHVETGFTVGLRWFARAFVGRSLVLTAGLAWRGLAALTGIGMATALVAGLTAENGDARLSSLTVDAGQPAPQETRAVRDVRQEPRALGFSGEGWVRIARPIAQFGLDSAELDRQQPVYEARRSADGASREDVLVFGGFAEPKPHLLMRVLTGRGEAEPSQPFVIGLVRQAAMRGMAVQRSGAPTTIDTKFGPVETADATLSDGEASRACIGLRHVGPDIGLSGWWCGTAQRPADRQQLICLLDRLDLLSAGDDRSLRATFARTELNRQQACLPPRLSSTGRKTSWLDADGRAPPLKTAARR